MITVGCYFTHSLKIMRIPQPIIPVRACLQPITVLWSGSGDLIEVLYIRCLNGRWPEAFELWALADDGVCAVHPYNRVKLRSEFREDTFQTFFFNARRFQIHFLEGTYQPKLDIGKVLRILSYVPTPTKLTNAISKTQFSG